MSLVRRTDVERKTGKKRVKASDSRVIQSDRPIEEKGQREREADKS